MSTTPSAIAVVLANSSCNVANTARYADQSEATAVCIVRMVSMIRMVRMVRMVSMVSMVSIVSTVSIVNTVNTVSIINRVSIVNRVSLVSLGRPIACSLHGSLIVLKTSIIFLRASSGGVSSSTSMMPSSSSSSVSSIALCSLTSLTCHIRKPKGVGECGGRVRWASAAGE